MSVETSSPLLVWATSDPRAQSCASVLSEHHEERVKALSCLDALKENLDQSKGATVCIFYTAPALHVAHALDGGATLEEAAAQWQTETADLLGFHRQNRARCTLLESGHLLRFAETGLARLGLAAAPGLFEPVAQSAGAITTLVAGTYLRNDLDLSDLVEEQAASSTILSNDADLEDATTGQEALQALDAHRSAACEQQKQLESLQAELGTLRDQLADSEESVRSAETEIARQATQLKELELGIAEARGARDVLQTQSSVLLSELRAATRQNEQQSQDLARLKGELGDQIAEMKKERDAQVQGLEAEIDRILNSRSMRLTSPLRSLMRLLGAARDV